MNWLDEIGQDIPEVDENLEVLDIAENESDWHAERLGKFTSSRMGDLMSQGRGKDQLWGQMADNYIYEKIAEKLTGVPHYIAETNAMAWGNDLEEEAFNKFKEHSGLDCQHMGTTFIKFNELSGGSPDGYVGEDGVIEIKCPYNSSIHLKTIITKEIDKKYMYQMQANMLFTDRSYCYYVSYDPRMPEALQLYTTKILRDNDICNQIAERLTEVSERLIKICEENNIKL
jgi:predicted phage-related endonuclease